jgi:hypothetical protein
MAVVAIAVVAAVMAVLSGVGAWKDLADLRSFAPLAKVVSRAEPAPSTVSAPVARETALPLPRRGEMALLRARALVAGGHLRDAMSVLDAVRPTDPQRPDVDRLRSEIQRQLLALTPVPSVDAPARNKGARDNP